MIRGTIKQLNPELVIFDPFVKTHRLEENVAGEMDFIIDLLVDLAIECNIAVDIPHHSRKGVAAPGDADVGRGSSAIIDAARLSYTLTTMAADEAKALGMAPEMRKLFVRLDSAKVNLLPPAGRATWFRLADVAIGNTTAGYPSGDSIQTVVPWTPPPVAETVARAASVFMELLDAFTAEGRGVSSNPKSPTYAPAAFAERPQGAEVGKQNLKRAMEYLLENRTIRLVNEGTAAKPRCRLVRGGEAPTGAQPAT